MLPTLTRLFAPLAGPYKAAEVPARSYTIAAEDGVEILSMSPGYVAPVNYRALAASPAGHTIAAGDTGPLNNKL